MSAIALLAEEPARMVNDPARSRKRMLFGVLMVTSPFIAVAAIYAVMFYDLTSGMVSKPTRSPNGRLVARVVHYSGDASDVRMETSGVHPFSLGSDDIYEYEVEDGWVSGFTWRDNRTLIVNFCFHHPHPSLPQRHWHGVTILFREDACATAPL